MGIKRVLLLALVAQAACISRYESGPRGAQLTVDPAVVAADGASTALITLRLPANVTSGPNPAVFFASDVGDAVITQPTTAAADGSFQARISCAVPGTHTITVEIHSGASALRLPQHALVTFNAPGASGPGVPSALRSSLQAAPSLVSDDGTTESRITLSVVDSFGNAVPGVGVTFAVSGTRNALSIESGLTDPAGLLETALSSTIAESKTVTAHVGSMAISTQVTFSADAVSTVTSTLLASPNTAVADGASMVTLQLTARNAAGTPVPGAAVAWTSLGTSNVFGATQTSTDATGTASTTLKSTHAERKVVMALVNNNPVTAAVTFVSGQPSAAMSYAEPVLGNGTAVADGTQSIVVRTVAADAQGNPVSGQSVTVTGPSGVPVTGVTDENGVFVTPITSTGAGTQTVTSVIDGAVTTSTTVTFVPGPISTTNTTFTASPQTVVADGIATTLLQLTLVDAKGNPIPGVAVMLSSDGSGDMLSNSSGLTNAAGIFSTSMVSTHAQLKNLSASVTGATFSAQVTFIAGSASSTNTTFSAAPTSLLDDGVSTTTLTFTVLDAGNNPVSGQAVTFSASGSSNTFSATTGSTNSSGMFTATLKSTLPQTETVTASLASFTKTANVTFTLGVPDSTTSSVTASPTSLTANGVATTTLTVTVKDSTGNAISGQSVNLASSGSSNTISPLSGTTNASGLFTATFKTTVAESKVVTAIIGSLNETTTVTFTAGPPATATSALTTNPNQVTADGVTTSLLTFTVKDVNGNLVPSQAVTFSSSSGANDIFVPASTGSTNASGVFTANIKSTKAEVSTVTASAAAASKTATITFQAGAPNSGTSSLVASPATVIADGTSTTSLTVTVKDVQGNNVSGQAISLSYPGVSYTLNPASGLTNAAGVFAATLKSTATQTQTLTASVVSAFTLTTPVTFVAHNVSASQSSVTVVPSAGTLANNSASTNVTVSLRDASGVPFPNQKFTLSATNTAEPSLTLNLTTDSNGNFSYPLVSFMAGAKRVSVRSGGIVLNANASFTQPTTTCTYPFLDTPPFVTGPTNASDARVADFNGDGNLDVVVSDPNTSALNFALGQGNGLFQQSAIATVGSGPGQVAPCDVNTDGKMDVVNVNVAAGTFSCVLGTGTGTFAAPVTTSVSGANMSFAGISCTDINHDLKPDVIVSNYATKRISVFLGSGSCTFGSAAVTTLASTPYSLLTADVTGDGNVDAVYPNGAGTLYVLAGNGGSGFAAAVTHATGTNNQAVTAADVNLDGKMDLVTANASPTSTISVLLGTGGGNFGTASTVNVSGISIGSISTGDFDGDTYPDLLFAGGTNQLVGIALNNRNGTFAAPVQYFESLVQYNAVPADVNNDGKLDVVTTAFSFNVGSGAHILLGKGDGTLESFKLLSGLSSVSVVAAGDVTGDGNIDIVAFSTTPAVLGVYVNAGDGTFGTPTSYSLPDAATSLRLIDLNYDGVLDVVASFGSASGGIAVLLNNGSGTLGSATVYPAGGSNAKVSVGDFNSDGILDLATVNTSSNTVSVLLGTGGGVFGAATAYAAGAAGSHPQAIAVSDFNLDGNQDLAVGLPGTTQVAVLLGNGSGGFGAAMTVPMTGLVTSVAIGDFNSDSYPDLCASTSDGNVTTFRGSVSGSLSTGLIYKAAQSTSNLLTLGDMNGDGLGDVIAALSEDGAAEVLFGKSDGTFVNPALYPMYNAPVSVVIADFNKDGHSDVATASNGSVTVHLYAGCP